PESATHSLSARAMRRMRVEFYLDFPTSPQRARLAKVRVAVDRSCLAVLLICFLSDAESPHAHIRDCIEVKEISRARKTEERHPHFRSNRGQELQASWDRRKWPLPN